VLADAAGAEDEPLLPPEGLFALCESPPQASIKKPETRPTATNVMSVFMRASIE
jgi:hypothetical protein